MKTTKQKFSFENAYANNENCGYCWYCDYCYTPALLPLGSYYMIAVYNE